MRILFSSRPPEHNARGLLRAFCTKRETLGRSRQRMGTWLPQRRRCKGEDVLQVLATGKRCGTHVIDGSSLRVVHGEPDGSSSPPTCATSLLLSFTTLHVFLLPLRRPLLLRERLRIRCAARLSNQEILVTLSSRSLGNSTDMYISGKIDDASRRRKIIHNFCDIWTDIYDTTRKSWRRYEILIVN